MYVFSPILACDASSALLWNWEEEIFTHNNICSVNNSMSKPKHLINSHLLGLACKVMAEK